MAHPLTPATSKTSTTAVKGYAVGHSLPIQLPPHHEMAFEKASIEHDEHGKYVCIPLIDKDPFGFERKRKEYKCKYCHSKQVSLKCMRCSEKLISFTRTNHFHLLTFSSVPPGNAVLGPNQVQKEFRYLAQTEEKQYGDGKRGAGAE